MILKIGKVLKKRSLREQKGVCRNSLRKEKDSGEKKSPKIGERVWSTETSLAKREKLIEKKRPSGGRTWTKSVGGAEEKKGKTQ